jgi:hypothetical protein
VEVSGVFQALDCSVSGPAPLPAAALRGRTLATHQPTPALPNPARPRNPQVWPGPSHFPDFLSPNATRWWAQQLAAFYKALPFDGIWLDMNEPSNFCSGGG